MATGADPVYLVGLTGGIGSGKSTVAARMRARGWQVIDADAIAREVVLPGSPALDDLVAHFGSAIRKPDGSLDRSALARLAFADDASKRALDRLTHPHIAAGIADRLAELAAAYHDEAPLIVAVDHPLLIETGQSEHFDALVVVISDTERRVRRLVEQRGLPEEDVRARMRAQVDDAIRRAVATHVLRNDGSVADLQAAADEVLARIEREARARVTPPT